MAISTRTETFLKVTYWLVLSSLQLFICYLLFTSGRGLAGAIWLLIGFLLIYVMYPVYFSSAAFNNQWPPYLTACPDYLTLIAPNTCVDFVGLGSPLLKKSDPANPPNPSDTNYVFSAVGSVEQKAAKAQQYGLSWDGIT